MGKADLKVLNTVSVVKVDTTKPTLKVTPEEVILKATKESKKIKVEEKESRLVSKGFQGPIGPIGVGVQGPPGPEGDPGPQGPPGDGSDKTYTHVQMLPASVWLINHNFNKYPAVTVIDSADSVVIGEITYIDSNNISITFSAGFAGKAYLN